MSATLGYVLAALAAGLAIGFYREFTQAREQVAWLRRQLAHATNSPAPAEPATKPRALFPAGQF